MRYLIDTHICLWWWNNDVDRIPSHVSDILHHTEHEVFFSAVSAYEIQLKSKIGKLSLPSKLEASLEKAAIYEGWKVMPVSVQAMECAGKLSLDHRDPFDRMLAAQAITEEVPILSADTKLDAFEVERIW